MQASNHNFRLSPPTHSFHVFPSQSGPGAFLPILSSLVGNAPTALSAQGSAMPGAGILANVGKPDWGTRKAVADCLRAIVLSLGPVFEVEGCWDQGDIRSLSGRCIRALEVCKYDKVRGLSQFQPCHLGSFCCITACVALACSLSSCIWGMSHRHGTQQCKGDPGHSANQS